MWRRDSGGCPVLRERSKDCAPSISSDHEFGAAVAQHHGRGIGGREGGVVKLRPVGDRDAFDLVGKGRGLKGAHIFKDTGMPLAMGENLHTIHGFEYAVAQSRCTICSLTRQTVVVSPAGCGPRG